MISPETCDQMQRLFEATVEMGTARKAFRRLSRDKVLKNLELGGKTGTIKGPDRSELVRVVRGLRPRPGAPGAPWRWPSWWCTARCATPTPRSLARRMLKEAFRSTLYAEKTGGPATVH